MGPTRIYLAPRAASNAHIFSGVVDEAAAERGSEREREKQCEKRERKKVARPCAEC